MEKQTTIPGIVRDDTGALLNKNNEALASYKAKKLQSKKIIQLEKSVNMLNSDICLIKEMIEKLLEKNKDC